MYYKKLLSRVILASPSVEDDGLYRLLRKVWEENKVHQTAPEEVEAVWKIVEEDEHAEEMMMCLMGSLMGSREQLVLLEDRRCVMKAALKRWIDEGRDMDLISSILKLGSEGQLEDDNLQKLVQLFVRNGSPDVRMLKQLLKWGARAGDDNLGNAHIEIARMQYWKWTLEKVLHLKMETNTVAVQTEALETNGVRVEMEKTSVTDGSVRDMSDFASAPLSVGNVNESAIEPFVSMFAEAENLNGSMDVLMVEEEEEMGINTDTEVFMVEDEAGDNMDTDEGMECEDFRRTPSEMDVETIGKILKERHVMWKDRRLKPHATRLGWTDAGYQIFGRWRAMLKGDRGVKLWSVDEMLEEIMRMREGWNVNTASVQVAAIGVVLGHLTEEEVRIYIGNEEKYVYLKDFVKKQQEMIADMKDVEEGFQQMSEKEKRIVSGLKWRELAEAVEQYVRTHPGVDAIETKEQLQHMMILAIMRLYVIDHTPRRLEYLQMRWRGDENDQPVNIYGNGVISIEDYKTERTYKQYKLRVGEETERILDAIVKYRSGEGNDYIFGNKNQVYSSSYRTGMVNKAMEIATKRDCISVNILRKLCLEDKREKGELEWSTLRKEYARQMGHSERMQQEVYKKRERESVMTEEKGEVRADEGLEAVRTKRKKGKQRKFATEVEEGELRTVMSEWRGEPRRKWKEISEELSKRLGYSMEREMVRNWGRTIESKESKEEMVRDVLNVT